MYKGFLHTHYLVVTLFLLIYVVKTILLLSDKQELLTNFTRKIRIPEMIISALFLITGIYLTTRVPFGGKYDYLFFIKIAMVLASIPIAVIGFKRRNKMLGALSLLLITGAFGIAEAYKKRKGEHKTESSVSHGNDGKSLYIAKCALCHGGDGKLGAAGAKDLGATLLDIPAIKEVILHGKGDMVPVSATEEEANAIAEYVDREIRGH